MISKYLSLADNPLWRNMPYNKYGTETDTIITFPADIIADEITGITIKGNMQQTDTPTPENPITPQECGERVCNLFDKSTMSSGYYAITTGIRENSSYYCSDFIPITAATYYFQNVVGSSNQNSVVVYDVNKQGLRYEKITGSNKVSGRLTFIEGDAYIRINCYATTDVDTVMVSLGSTALPYEPYGFKIPISSGNTTTTIYLSEPLRKISEYADTVEADGTVTRRIIKWILTGDEDWREQYSGEARHLFRTDIPTDFSRTKSELCTHFVYSDAVSASETDIGFNLVVNNSYARFRPNDAINVSLDDWKQYVSAQYTAGTPITVWYVLTEPIIEQITVPTIPTVPGSQTFDVDTSLKPSSVDITYNGWHKHIPKEYNNGSWS